ncbi:hypothetical protein BOTBODRAFT_110874, partial [Botryobasidium botryosum FD-172 SS1]
KDFNRRVPKSLVVEVKINDKPVCALLDSGSLADFMSTTLADQLKVPLTQLAKQLSVQMAVTGSRSKVNYSTNVNLKYQAIDETRRFDIINLDSYNLILGTPFLYQHKAFIGFNPLRVVIGSPTSLPIKGPDVGIIRSLAADLFDDQLEQVRDELRKYASSLCADMEDTSLPPLRAVNHTIPLIDENKVYTWRPSKCADALLPQWQTKQDAYLKSGRWRFQTGHNAAPLMIIQKKPAADGTPRIRTVVDK